MQVDVSIGQNHHFELREALLIYRSTDHENGNFGNTYVTHHEVNAEQSRQATNARSGKDANHRIRAIPGPVPGGPGEGGISARHCHRAHRASDCLVDAATKTPDVLRNDAR